MKPRGATRDQGSWYVIQAGGLLMLHPKVATWYFLSMHNSSDIQDMRKIEKK